MKTDGTPSNRALIYGKKKKTITQLFKEDSWYAEDPMAQSLSQLDHYDKLLAKAERQQRTFSATGYENTPLHDYDSYGNEVEIPALDSFYGLRRSL